MTLLSAAVARLPGVPAHMLALVDSVIEAARLDGWESDQGTRSAPADAAAKLATAKAALLDALTIPAAWADVAAERAAYRDEAHEDTLRKGEIATAAAYYLAAAGVAESLGIASFGGGPVRGMPQPWPFDRKAFLAGPVRPMLVRAVVFGLAAIERIDRAAPFVPDPAEAAPAARPKRSRSARRRAAARARRRAAAGTPA